MRRNKNIEILENEVNAELTKVYEWLASNKLTLNVKKSKYMIISKQKNISTDLSIKIDGTELEKCVSYKYLGVFFDEELNWKTHINHVSLKVSKACGSLAKLRHCLEVDTLREVYHALIHSYLRYGLIAWGSATKTALQPLRTIINRAIRIMCFAPYGAIDITPLYEILDILDLDSIYKLELGKFVFRQKRGTLPVSIANYFHFRNNPQHGYNLRSQTRPREPQIVHRTATGKRSIHFRGSELWTEVPDEIKTAQSPKLFKKLYKLHFLSSTE